MGLTEERFAEHLVRGTEAARRELARLCWNSIRAGSRHSIRLNASPDGHPLKDGERLFPDHGVPQPDRETHCTGAAVVHRLWREGFAPEWIDRVPPRAEGPFLSCELSC